MKKHKAYAFAALAASAVYSQATLEAQILASGCQGAGLAWGYNDHGCGQADDDCNSICQSCYGSGGYASNCQNSQTPGRYLLDCICSGGGSEGCLGSNPPPWCDS